MPASRREPHEPLPGTLPLDAKGDLGARMVMGIDRYLTREIDGSAARREARWAGLEGLSPERYAHAIESRRDRLRRILGVVDARDPVRMEIVADLGYPPEHDPPEHDLRTTVRRVRWSVFRGVHGEGLLLTPMHPAKADVVALADCDESPEMRAGLTDSARRIPFARSLAESGCRVIVPFLIDRDDAHSGIPGVRMTNQPHREFLYRAAYEVGRHILGYEIQKVLAAIDWMEAHPDRRKRPRPTGVFGYGEGGRIALYVAALDPRIRAAGVAGAFGPREEVWREPIYRNVWGLLEEFGDAEVAAMIAPRALTVGYGTAPEIAGPPPEREGRSGAAPGRLSTPTAEAVTAEFMRAISGPQPAGDEVSAAMAMAAAGEDPAGCALPVFLLSLGVPGPRPPRACRAAGEAFDAEARRKRQFGEILEDTQRLMRESEERRAEFWAGADSSSPERWSESCEPYRDYLWDEIIGRLPPATEPANPRTRVVYETAEFIGYEVTLDVYPDVFAYGILLVPRGIAPGERRPAVVCQHGLEGRPQDVADPAVDHPAYHQYACCLAERGFVTFAPQNPYLGGDRFRVLIRKAHPLKQSLYAFIVRQHETILGWLATLPFVDPARIGFYGLSYGGKTAMRIPPLLPGYALSICSADFNEWVWKNVSARSPYCYLITGEYDMPEFDLANRFNYAELSGLICPRPFMVERGHHDGVAPDEWVAYEYAKTRRRYALMGLGHRTEIEFFDGPHTINGRGTFDFLICHLGSSEPGRSGDVE